MFTDRPRGASASADGLEHTENAVHLQVFYRFAASPKLDISVGLGPTFFSIDAGPDRHRGRRRARRRPSRHVAAEVSESPVGFNIGADATYMFNERFGAGVLLRYRDGLGRHGAAERRQRRSLDAGGFQFAAGLRVRF